MRLIAFVVALVLSGPAFAEWKEFNSVSEGFGVVFPADPDVQEVAMFEVVPGKMVPARIYSARYENSLFKMTVVDGRDAGLQEGPVVEQAIKRLTQGGQVKIDFPHRIYRIYGRQLSVQRPDSLTTAALFFVNDRLYQIESTKFRGGSDTDAIRFQQSLTFDRNVANRTRQQMDAFRVACQGRNANPAGLDDPRCTRQ
ncbi:MAG TPA: hypothetical protein VEU06_11040 [Micropepsaceae bacterium]|nr:hypothetical protein [Micropepsaceae bacterium]